MPDGLVRILLELWQFRRTLSLVACSIRPADSNTHRVRRTGSSPPVAKKDDLINCEGLRILSPSIKVMNSFPQRSALWFNRRDQVFVRPWLSSKGSEERLNNRSDLSVLH